MTQVGYLGSQAVKYLFIAFKHIMGKIFNSRNVTVPLRAASKVILGTDFKNSRPIDPQRLDLFEAAWGISQVAGSGQNGPPSLSSHFVSKCTKLIKSLLYVGLGLSIAVVLALFRQNKSSQLNKKETQEKLHLEERK